MFLRVGSGTNESTMSRFSTHIKSLHILGNFRKLTEVKFEDASTSFCGWKAIFGSCLFTHDWASTSNKKSSMDSTTVCDTSKIRRSRYAWPWPRHAQSEWVWVLKTETEIGAPARVEADTWTFVCQRGSLRALGTGYMFFGTTARRTLTLLQRPSLAFYHDFRVRFNTLNL